MNRPAEWAPGKRGSGWCRDRADRTDPEPGLARICLRVLVVELSAAHVRRSRAHQRRLAVVACLLWVLGYEVLPDVHLATHGALAAHRHDAGDRPARFWRVRTAHAPVAHQHGAATHQHGRAPRGERAAAPDPGHGAHSLAHRTIAIATPAPVIIAPLPTSWRLWSERVDVLGEAAWRPTLLASARGPPPTHG